MAPFFLIGTLLLFLLIGLVLVNSLFSLFPNQEREGIKLPFTKPLNSYWEKVTTDNVSLSIAIFVLATVLIGGLAYILNILEGPHEFWDGVLVEMVGMLFDIALLLLLFNWIAAKGEKRLKIARYKEELDDYRGWHGDEAKYRVRGILTRMINLGVQDIDINGLHLGDMNKDFIKNVLLDQRTIAHTISLEDARLSGISLNKIYLNDINLRNADLSYSRISDTYFVGVNLRGVNFNSASLIGAYMPSQLLDDLDISFANLEGAIFRGSHFERADLQSSNLTGADLVKTNLKEACLHNANLENANLRNANLYKADLEYANLSEAILSYANLLEVNGLTIDQLKSAKSIYKIKVDDHLSVELESLIEKEN